MASENESTNPGDIELLRIILINYNRKNVIDVTNLVGSFNFYESLFTSTCSCNFILMDATNVLSKIPMIGEEVAFFQYRTKGFKKDGEPYPVRQRSFRLYKISDRVEAREGQTNYKVHGIDDHYFINEAIDVSASFVGQNCTLAANTVFNNFFIKTPPSLTPIDRFATLKGIGNEDVKESSNSSTFISPGITPFEVIEHLKKEAQHKTLENTSNYFFYQDIDGFHLTTLSELKNQDTSFVYYVKDAATEDISEQEEKKIDDTTTSVRNNIISYKIRKAYDTIKNLDQGLYGNRVVALDLLTKRFDENIFNYTSEWNNLSPIDSHKLISEDSLYAQVGSTQTRFITTELLTTSIDTGNPKFFSNSDQPSYKQTPYFYPIDKENPDLKKDKIAGTIDNKPGQKVELFIPEPKDEKGRYQLFMGNENPVFFVTDVRHAYLNAYGSYITTITCIKDSYNMSIEKVFESENEELVDE